MLTTVTKNGIVKKETATFQKEVQKKLVERATKPAKEVVIPIQSPIVNLNSRISNSLRNSEVLPTRKSVQYKL